MTLLGSCNSLLNQTGALKGQNTDIKFLSGIGIERRNTASCDDSSILRLPLFDEFIDYSILLRNLYIFGTVLD